MPGAGGSWWSGVAGPRGVDVERVGEIGDQADRGREVVVRLLEGRLGAGLLALEELVEVAPRLVQGAE
jgi:hypothetical protein